MFCLQVYISLTIAVMSLENWLAGLDPLKLNATDASGALKKFYDSVGEPTISLIL